MAPTNKTNIVLWSTNIRGLIANFDEFSSTVKLEGPDIVVLCETFLTDSVRDSILFLPNYSFFRRDRGTGFGGGVIVYYKNSLHVRNLNFGHINHESIWFRITCTDISYVFCAIYWPPSGPYDATEHLEDVISSFSCKYNDVIVIVGDLNAHHHSWPFSRSI